MILVLVLILIQEVTGKEESRKNLLKRSEEHTSELQSQSNLVCRLLLEKTKADPHRSPFRRAYARSRAGADCLLGPSAPRRLPARGPPAASSPTIAPRPPGSRAAPEPPR